MAINLNALRTQIANQLGVGGPDFDSVFIDAVNRVIIDLETDVGEEVEQIVSIGTPLTLDAEYYPMFREGAAYYVAASGRYGKEPDTKAYQKYRFAVGQAQAYYAEKNGLLGGNVASTWGS